MTRRLLLYFFLCLPLILLTSSAKLGQMPLRRQMLVVTAEAVPLSRSDPAITQAGDLVYLGGWRLSARHADFGGWSAMHATPNGFRLMSDAGAMLDLPRPSAGTMRAVLQELPKGCGQRWHKDKQDAESLTADDQGNMWVALEQQNIICRIDAAGHVRTIAPAAMANWSSALGAEAMVRVRDGRFLVFAEADPKDTDGPSPVLLFSGDPLSASVRRVSLRLASPDGFRPSDAAQLPDGRILVLQRAFAPPLRWQTRLIALDLAELRENALLQGREVARLAPPMLTDNFEALAVTQEKRRPIIWIASDDNFWSLQQTYLLKFTLKD